MKKPSEIVPLNILTIRKSLGLKQKPFSDLIGVSLTTLWRLEKGHEKPSKTLVKLLQFIITQKK